MTTLSLERTTVATLTLNKPEVHNAFDEGLIKDMIAALEDVAQDDSIRVLVLKGNGKSFCAGADLNWMRKMAAYSQEENYQDSRALDRLMHTLNTLPKPTIAWVHGSAYGGGVGLIACCDVVLAEKSAKFCLSEVKLGLIPAVISPYVVHKIGVSQARRYFLTGEVFTASQAQIMGLVHEIGPLEELDTLLNKWTQALLQGGPIAQTQAKKLISDICNKPLDQPLRNDLARRIASIRVSPEGQKGLSAFLNKEKVSWG